jgi:hypothetical protein
MSISRALALGALAVLLPAFARADGGAVRLRGGSEAWVVTVFTAPDLRVGPVDVSVLVQERESGRALLDADVTVTLQPPEGEAVRVPATRARSTNKLLLTALADLPVPGSWTLLVSVQRAGQATSLRGELPVGPAFSRLSSLGVLLGLPPVVTALFACHQALARRRRGRR